MGLQHNASQAEATVPACEGQKGKQTLSFRKKEMLNTTFKSLVLKLLLLKHDLCTSPTCSNLFKVIAFYKPSWYQRKCIAEEHVTFHTMHKPDTSVGGYLKLTTTCAA